MTRIIAGAARGRRLATPRGAATRPTSDRVREAVFSALESSLGGFAGLRVLDLYAGSGAVGLEAVSRGAVHATLVEREGKVAALARQNAQRLGFTGVRVVCAAAERLVRAPDETGQEYDVAFLDPPYSLEAAELNDVLAGLVKYSLVRRGSSVVVERSTRSEEPVWPEGLVRDRGRKYGETTVWYVQAT